MLHAHCYYFWNNLFRCIFSCICFTCLFHLILRKPQRPWTFSVIWTPSDFVCITPCDHGHVGNVLSSLSVFLDIMDISFLTSPCDPGNECALKFFPVILDMFELYLLTWPNLIFVEPSSERVNHLREQVSCSKFRNVAPQAEPLCFADCSSV